MKTPWQYAETGNEHSHQVALFMWANMAVQFGPMAANDPLSYIVKDYVRGYGTNGNMSIHELRWLHAIKNSGHGDAVRGNHARAEGVKAGVPDIFLPVPRLLSYYGEIDGSYAGLYIELKRPKSNGKAKGMIGDDQTPWIEYLRSAGYAVEVCVGWEVARDTILKYLGRV